MTIKSGRRWVRPGLGLTLASAVALAALTGLGTWQLQRLQWKDALIAERQAQSTAPAMALPAVIGDPAALAFRRVRVTGRFLHARELYLTGRSHKRQIGVHVVTPLLLEDGRALLVDRGWVPMEKRDPARRAEGQLDGSVTLEGLLRLGGWTGSAWLRPENRSAENTWIWVDPPAMTAAAGLEQPVTALYLAAGPAANPGGLPKGGQTVVAPRNDHLKYALTWFALAGALLVIFTLFHYRRAE